MSACREENTACALGESRDCEHRHDVAGARSAVRESLVDAGTDAATRAAARDDSDTAVEPAFRQTADGFALDTADPEVRFVVEGAAVYLVRGEARILVLAPSQFARAGRDEAAATSEARTRGRRLELRRGDVVNEWYEPIDGAAEADVPRDDWPGSRTRARQDVTEDALARALRCRSSCGEGRRDRKDGRHGVHA